MNALSTRLAVLATLALGARTPADADAQLVRPKSPALADLTKAPSSVVGTDGSPLPAGVELRREWTGNVCRSKLVNGTPAPVKVKEVVLFDVPHACPPETKLYGEGFTMLSETGGTLGQPRHLGYSDAKHYRIPQPADATSVYGLLTLQPPGGDHALYAFASSRRFVGRFDVRPNSLRAVLDAEGLTLAPGQAWELEEFHTASGTDRNKLLASLAERVVANHPPRPRTPVPTGWCSWYCFGRLVKAEQVLGNLAVIAKDLPALKYVQVDDGFQAAMGDWLTTGAAFGGGVRDVLRKIDESGSEPAIWVAPFIAEKDSKLFREHPDWFIKDAEGKPLSSDRVTFGGWRRAPWYALDGTHPEAQKHLESVFRTMRREWGCTYFKLDANFWGTMHGGRFHDPAATRVEAYRRGMDAVLRGAGDGFVLGCNHPIWPSFGLIDGSRSSGDINRSWPKFEGTARMNLLRNWQNGRLWWNDPDCVVLSGNMNDDEYHFHATAIYASGGMLLSGDDLTRLAPERMAMLRKLLPPTGVAADFPDDSLHVGYVRQPGKTTACVLNWDEDPRPATIRFAGQCRVTDFWTGEVLGLHDGKYEVPPVPRHGARMLVCELAP